jgi:hypothetical protein
MDEIFGYFPPVANPPSKLPLLTLLKQGRAFGLGVVLVTQNPVDLDYKGLSNTGTWFIGRLQTERDKARVLEGLEGVAGGTGMKFDRQEMEQILAGLSNRIFLLNNVHENGSEVFETRWAMSYLRGPVTRKQIKALMDPIKAQAAGTTAPAAQAAAAGASAQPGAVTGSSSPAASPVSSNASQNRQPILPPEVSQYFIPVRAAEPGGATLVYHPTVLGAAQVRFNDKKVDTTKDITALAQVSDGVVAVDWESAALVELVIEDLEKSPAETAQFGELPSPASKAKSYDKWQKDMAGWLYRSQKVELFKSPSLDETSNPDEAERDFRIRLQQKARERRDAAAEQLRQKYAPKIAALEERKRRAQQAVEREAEQARGQKMQTAISFGATLLSSFMGRKAVSLSSLGRATSAARGVGRSIKESQDVGRAEESVAAVDQQMAELDAQFKEETAAMEASGDPQTETLETTVVKPKKADIAIKLLSLAWAPYWHDSQGQKTPAWE